MLLRWQHATRAAGPVVAGAPLAQAAVARLACATDLPATAAVAAAAACTRALHSSSFSAAAASPRFERSSSIPPDAEPLTPRRGAAKAWSVRGTMQLPSRKQKRAAFKEDRAEMLERKAREAAQRGEVPQMYEQGAAYEAEGKRPRAPKVPRRQPQQPHHSELSHTSSDFFKPLPRALVEHDDAHAAAPAAPAGPATFQSLGVASHVHTRLAVSFDIFTPTPIQTASIPFLLDCPHFTERDFGTVDERGGYGADGLLLSPQAEERRARLRRRVPLPRDLVIQEMTGSGKTLSYLLPLLSLVDNFKSPKHVQGVIVAPTRELAVQIHRVVSRLNDIRNAGKKRKANPVKIRLAVGAVTEEYAEQVREEPGHIIISTPATLESLLLGVRARRVGRETPPIIVRPSINLRHLRMLVLDEVDHLLLPATAGKVERILQNLTSTASHGSMHRLGRIVLVSAALSQRVHVIASKWLHRPVTATSAGLLDGWVEERRMLKDRFHLRKEKSADAAATTAVVGQTQNPSAVREAEHEDALDDDVESDDMEHLSASQHEAEEEEVQPLTVAERLAQRGVDLDSMDPETRAAYEEADVIGDEEEELAEERAAIRELKEIDLQQRKEKGLLTEAEEKDSNVVRADEFMLPGGTAARRAAATAEDDESLPAAAEEPLMPLLANFPAAQGTSPFGGASSLSAVSASAAAATPVEVDEVPLPSAADATVRYLPASMNHLAVHVAPSLKPNVYPSSSAAERKTAVYAWAKLLSQLHAVLKPRVAMVFFKRAADALEVAEVLREKRVRVELLLSGSGLRAADRLRAIESVLHGSVHMVLCTDLAARGLDIRGLTHVINFDLPSSALDYVHRAGRVERLGGKKGCTVVTLVRDHREEHEPTKLEEVLKSQQEQAEAQAAAEAAAAAAAATGSALQLPVPLPRRRGTFAGVQVDKLAKLQGQLHLDMPSRVLKSGQLIPLVVQPRTQHIATPPTPKKTRPASAAPLSTAAAASASASTLVSSSSTSGINPASARAFSTFARARSALLRPFTATTSSLSAFSQTSSSSSRRSISTRPALLHNSTADPDGADVHVIFITPDGERVPVTGKEGENLLALAHANNVELEGACEASLACSTCHVILPDEYYAKLDTPVDEEADMLDLAFGLTDTSRLGCQVKLSKELEGMEITLPSATRNMAVDGFKPQPH